MVKAIMHGCNGKMGQVISGLVKEDDVIEIVAGIDKFTGIENPYPVFTSLAECDVQADVVIDFSNAAAVDELLDVCVEKTLPVVLCTTGLSEEQLAKVKEAGEKVAVLRSANMSLGVNLLMKLLKDAAREDMVIIEDDYNGELRYSTHPMPCVQNYDTENTVYLGSFSKILLPSVRISYMVLPQKLTDEYNKIKKYTNQTASKTEQIALAKYINNGKLDVHLRKARRIYLEKINHMHSKIVFYETSLYVSLIFKDKTIDDSVIKKIDDALIKTMQFNKAENMIVLSFSGIKDVKIESGIKLLYETISK